MGKMVMKDPYLEWGQDAGNDPIDISDFVRAIGHIDNVAVVDVTTSQSDVTPAPAIQREFGVRTCALEAVLVQDLDAGALHAKIGPTYGTKVTVKVRPHRTARGPTNPEWTGSLFFNDYGVFGGEIGARSDVAGTWPIDGSWSAPDVSVPGG